MHSFSNPMSLLLVAVLCGLYPGVILSADTPITKLHAMVIGNGAYTADKLVNPANDANSLSEVLADLGFQVTTKIDLTHQEMDLAVTQFCRGIDEGGLAFFFFAGHGIQVDGENYLIPVDAEIPDQSHVKYKAVSLSLILDSLSSSRSNMNVVVLDCCRNNPFERSWNRGILPRGLAAETSIPEGMIIAFATSPGKTAADGDGQNSPYTEELITALKQRPADGLLLREVFFTASRAVKERTGQSPWVNMEASLDNFYLRPSVQPLVVPVVPRPTPEPIVTSQGPMLDGLKSTDPADSVPTVVSLESATPVIQAEDKALFDQAALYQQQAQYDNAVMAYTAILEKASLSPVARQQARVRRAAAYLGRGSLQDLNYAIIDKLAAGFDGIHLTVRVDSAELKVGSIVNGSVSHGQVLLITKASMHKASQWFWVASVNGDETLTGWVAASAVVKSPGEVRPAVVTAKPSTISPSVTSPTVPQYKPVQPSYQSNQPYLPPPNYSQSTLPSQTVPSQTVPSQNSSFGLSSGLSSTPVQSRPAMTATPYTQPQPTTLSSPRQPSYSNSQWTPSQTGNFNSSNNWRPAQSNFIQPRNQQQVYSNGRNSGFSGGGNQGNSGAKSIWATPQWESPAQIRKGIANGTLRW